MYRLDFHNLGNHCFCRYNQNVVDVMKPQNNPYKIVQMFEDEMASYTGAPFAVAVDSCTNAIRLCLEWHKLQHGIESITIPQRTYLSVPQQVLMAGFDLKFEDIKWKGIYQLKPTPIYDAAKRLTSGMYLPNTMMCLSFHIKKHIKIGKGGMILTDNKDAYGWFKKARYEGRSEVKYHDDNIQMLGWNCYMRPDDAARGLMLLQNFPEHNEDLPENPPYRDLKEFEVFRDVETVDNKMGKE